MTLRPSRSLAALTAPLGLVMAACAPANVAGAYTVQLTNRENSCNAQGFVVGESTRDVPFTVTQNGGMVTGEVGGLAGAAIGLGFGSNRFTGTVGGASVEMTMVNPRAESRGSCAFTWEVRVAGTLVANSLQGSVTYRPMTNGHPDCTAMNLNNCRILQDFSGSRPPMP